MSASLQARPAIAPAQSSVESGAYRLRIQLMAKEYGEESRYKQYDMPRPLRQSRQPGQHLQEIVLNSHRD
jgi:hypothetical protein